MIVAHLYAIGALSDDVDVISLDLDVPLNEAGLVELDVETIPLRRGSHLRVASTNEQQELPFNA
jgi:hypothetical protein